MFKKNKKIVDVPVPTEAEAAEVDKTEVVVEPKKKHKGIIGIIIAVIAAVIGGLITLIVGGKSNKNYGDSEEYDTEVEQAEPSDSEPTETATEE